jgi:hypothetical protein
MKKFAAVSLSLACGACTGWAFALAVDLVRPAPAAFEPPPRAALPVPAVAPAAKRAGPDVAPQEEPEKVEAEDDEGCG